MKNNYLILKLCFLFLINLSLFAQNDYTVSPIPHQTYSFNAIPISSLDDIYSPTIDIGFTFNFAGTDYTQFSANAVPAETLKYLKILKFVVIGIVCAIPANAVSNI